MPLKYQKKKGAIFLVTCMLIIHMVLDISTRILYIGSYILCNNIIYLYHYFLYIIWLYFYYCKYIVIYMSWNKNVLYVYPYYGLKTIKYITFAIQFPR